MDRQTGYLYTGRLEPAPWFVESYVHAPMGRKLYMVRFRPPGWEAPAALTVASGLNKSTAEFIVMARNVFGTDQAIKELKRRARKEAGNGE